MRILLLGEYSNVHATLAKGLRTLGHNVVVASNGDSWKNYPRDIDLARNPGKWGGVGLMAKVYATLTRLRNYDIVQLINPMFIELKAEKIRPIYDYLRNHNGAVVLGAFGMDYYWVSECVEKKPLRYSDFNIGDELRTNPDAIKYRDGWIGTAHERLNKYIANDCDHIVTGLYEYDVCYRPNFPDKTTFIPFPIEMPPLSTSVGAGRVPARAANGCTPLRIFIGINKERSEYKGTDIMLRAAEDVVSKYSHRAELIKVESVPFDEYQRLMEGSDIILDQLYSYTPSMNPLLAMSKGIVCVGGGEPENYQILGEEKLRPIINVVPNYHSVCSALEQVVTNPSDLCRMKRESVEYVKKHHDYIKVAKQYETLYNKVKSEKRKTKNKK